MYVNLREPVSGTKPRGGRAGESGTVKGRRLCRRATTLLVALVGGAGCSEAGSGELEAVIERFDALAARRPWPGFAATEIPLALYDAERTYLIRHPAPPAGFRPMRGTDGVMVSDSVHPEMRANTVVSLAGARPATGFWDRAAGVGADTLARTLLHEAFHAFQSERHPSWTANEVSLFTYPAGRATLIGLRRLETGALRRALGAPDSVRVLCWSQAFLRIRRDRFSRLPEEAVAYERGTELREGLARYVAAYAAGDPRPELTGDGFLPEDVRSRGYATGHALAVLLDDLDPGWKRALEAGERESLDDALAAAVDPHPVRRCGPTPDEQARARTVARADSAALVRRNEEELARFDTASGWRIEIVAARGGPLWPGQFDPLNVRVLGGLQVLHSRSLELSGDAGSIDVRDAAVLTRGVGPHPLFDGVAAVRVGGLRSEPTVVARGDTTRVTAEGVRVELRGATLSREGRLVRLVLER